MAYVKPYSIEIRKEAIRLREKGFLIKEIADKLDGPSFSIIVVWLKHANVKRKKVEKKVKRNKFSFEEVRPMLFKWARFFSNNRYDFWELVSAVWLMGRVQNVSSIKFASNRAEKDMIDYMRTQEGRMRHHKSGKEDNKHRFKRTEASLDTPLYDNEIKEFALKDILPQEDTSFDEMEAKDIWDFIFSNGFLDNQHKEILRLRYKEELTMKKVALRVGCSEGNISLILGGLLPRLRAILMARGIMYV